MLAIAQEQNQIKLLKSSDANVFKQTRSIALRLTNLIDGPVERWSFMGPTMGTS